jgi:hypothetical protein
MLIRTTLRHQDMTTTQSVIPRDDRVTALDRLLDQSVMAWFEAKAAKSLTMSRKIGGHDISTTVTSLDDTPYRTWKLDGESSSYSEVRRILTRNT